MGRPRRCPHRRRPSHRLAWHLPAQGQPYSCPSDTPRACSRNAVEVLEAGSDSGRFGCGSTSCGAAGGSAGGCRPSAKDAASTTMLSTVSRIPLPPPGRASYPPPMRCGSLRAPASVNHFRRLSSPAPPPPPFSRPATPGPLILLTPTPAPRETAIANKQPSLSCAATPNDELTARKEPSRSVGAPQRRWRGHKVRGGRWWWGSRGQKASSVPWPSTKLL